MIARTKALVVVALVAAIGFTAEVSHGALAAAAGGSSYSGTLSKNKAIRKQQLICDPDEPIAGSTSVSYDPNVVTLSGLIFGPGYTGSGMVEVDNDGSVFLTDITTYLQSPFGRETGYVQVAYSEPIIITDVPEVGVGSSHTTHGQILPPSSYLTIDNDGPFGVDTHALFFDYLANVPDSTIATYKIFADGGTHGNTADFLRGFNSDDGLYTVPFNQIASATVSGSLDTVPLPPAALIGGVTMLGMIVVRRFRNRRRA